MKTVCNRRPRKEGVEEPVAKRQTRESVRTRVTSKGGKYLIFLIFEIT